MHVTRVPSIVKPKLDGHLFKCKLARLFCTIILQCHAAQHFQKKVALQELQWCPLGKMVVENFDDSSTAHVTIRRWYSSKKNHVYRPSVFSNALSRLHNQAVHEINHTTQTADIKPANLTVGIT